MDFVLGFRVVSVDASTGILLLNNNSIRHLLSTPLKGRGISSHIQPIDPNRKNLTPMDDDVELEVLIVTLFGLVAQLFMEVNTFVVLMSYGFLKFHRHSSRRSCLGHTYSLRSKVPHQIEKLHYLVDHHNETCKDHLRMNTDSFNRPCYLLRNIGGLRDTRNVSISEQVAIFLTVLSHHTKNRVIKHSFKRSGFTISKYFNSVLDTLLKLHNVLLATPEPVPGDNNDYRWKYFKGYLCALDGTYIPVRVPHSDIPRYRNHKGSVSVNVLAVCDQHMNFTFVLSGWEGSAADSRVLRDAVTRPNGLRAPNGCYYLCDGGYTNCNGFLAPYRGVRYHLREWDEGRQPQNQQEYFNMKHAKARNCIKRAFGILKARKHMAVDPFEAEVDEIIDDSIDVGEPTDAFIDQVESSQLWTIMRDYLAIQMFASYE
ncbi:hypothetical protein ACS0TY_017384 [Phlomoides rotata]